MNVGVRVEVRVALGVEVNVALGVAVRVRVAVAVRVGGVAGVGVRVTIEVGERLNVGDGDTLGNAVPVPVAVGLGLTLIANRTTSAGRSAAVNRPSPLASAPPHVLPLKIAVTTAARSLGLRIPSQSASPGTLSAASPRPHTQHSRTTTIASRHIAL
ncbi:MAG TPA: hypothetical protein VN812_01380 [Candidatus Acidoferrales bacterium]|nr:hypothetical protein [Candidatus Acidoferrales bacterium]